MYFLNLFIRLSEPYLKINFYTGIVLQIKTRYTYLDVHIVQE